MISQEQLQRQLTKSLSEVLYLDASQIDIDKSFIDLGLDSIVGVEWLNAINKQYKTAIPASVVYDYPTIRKLASYLFAEPLLNDAESHHDAESHEETDADGNTKAGTDAESRDETGRAREMGSTRETGIPDGAGAGDESGISDVPRPRNERGTFGKTGAGNADAPPLIREISGVRRLGARPVSLSGTNRFSKQRGIQFQPKYEDKFKRLYFYSSDCTGDFAKDGVFSVNYVISPESNICLGDHQVFGEYLLPTDAYIELIYAAASTYFDIEQACLKKVTIINPLTGSANRNNYLRIVFSAHDQGLQFAVTSSHSPDHSNEKTHMQGLMTGNPAHEKMVARLAANTNLALAREAGHERLKNLQKEVTVGNFYSSLQKLSFGDNFALGELSVPDHGLHFLLDPAVLFGALTTSMFFGTDQLSKRYGITDDVFIPSAIENIAINGRIDESVYYCYAEIIALEKDVVKLYFEIVDRSYHPVLVAESINLQRISGKFVRQMVSATNPQAGSRPISGLESSSGIGRTPEAAGDVAIIGMSCRFPMSEDVNAFWENLKSGTNCISEVPGDRWKAFGNWYDPDPHHPGTSHNRWGGFIEGIDLFDPLFFGISPNEAEFMDPQQRIFLEECWKTIENAGYAPGSLSEQPCGVYVGCAAGDYGKVLAAKGQDTNGAAFLGTSNSILAARIAYHLNLKGPSMAIDTACSSSLTAVHLACESIRNRENIMALAGGVALMVTPGGHILTSQVGMQSKTGRCASFDESADGTVFSEGCGVVLLKSLSEAVKDNDRILGVIKASGINQDGKTNGITAPSTISQTRLLTQTYEKYNIDPGRISYVEAHGTGTPMGDPIEVSALTAAFRKFSPGENYCAIGSVKSNVGHSSFAAGVSGLIKVLLCLKYRKLVPSIHYESPNPHISLDRSPFFVNTAYRDWESDESRLACINSFGFSGTNAHLVIAEYPLEAEQQLPVNIIDPDIHIIPLSAKTDDQLAQKAKDLLTFIRENRERQELGAVAYTLQIGRDSMEYRLGFIVRSAEQLAEKLQAYVNGEKNIPDTYQGQARRSTADLGALMHDDEIKESIVGKLIAGKNSSKLLELWVRGLEIDWNKFYHGKRPRRVSLPVYPFAKESYWVEGPEEPIQTVSGTSGIHPLLHRNSSDLNQQRYQTVFSGEEFFFTDHRVGGRKVLPGVAYLEMARAAVQDAIPRQPESSCLELHNTVWLQPLVGNPGQQVFIDLSADEQQQVDFEIYSASAESRHPHCQGRAFFSPGPPDQQLDIQQLLAGMTQGELQVADFYAAYAGMGIDYGPAHKAVTALYKGERSLIARLRLPPPVAPGKNDFLLHPSMMDCALQASLGLIADPGQEQSFSAKPSLPFALEFLRILSPCTDEMIAWVRYADGSGPDGAVIKLDIDLCDQHGNICVQMHGFSARELSEQAGETSATENRETIAGGLELLVPVWSTVNVDIQKKASLSRSTRVLVLASRQAHADWVRACFPDTQFLPVSPESTAGSIQAELDARSFDQLIWMAPDLSDAGGSCTQTNNEQLVEAQEQGVLAVFRIVKGLLRSNYADKTLQWTILTGKTQRVRKGEELMPAHAGVAGLTGSLAKEFPHWNIRLLDIDSLEFSTAAGLLALDTDKQGNGLALREGEWFRQEMARMQFASPSNTVYKQKGVYVVIGGAGGLGEVWSRFMIRHYQARIVWIGRREPDAGINEKISRLGEIGDVPVYIPADATDYKSLKRAFEKIAEVYPRINGVVHSAIVLQDQSILHMDEAKFRSSLAAKVDISVNMDRVFGGQDLDFMLFFSSVISFSKSPGQSNYAAGCTFKDSFAQDLNRRRPYPVKIINWGYWGTTGIVGNESYKTMMEQAGIGSIEPEEGMTALQTLVNSATGQLVLLKTLNRQVLDGFNVSEAVTAYPRSSAVKPPDIAKMLRNLKTGKRPPALEKELSNMTLENLQAEILAATLLSLGFFKNGISKITDLPTDKRTALYYERWLSRSISYLQERQWLDREMTVAAKIRNLEDLWDEWENKKTEWATNPNLVSQVALLEACLKGLPDILSGKQLATDILFPGSSMKLVEGIYKDNALADMYNEVLGETLSAYIQQKLDAGQAAEIRILEIGAGTGGTTARLLPLLKKFDGKIAEYCYTDISKAFLMHAEAHFTALFPPLTTAVFDVTRPLVSQAVAAAHYDVAIAANVLHATPDIRQALRNAKAVLKNGGLLLLNEISSWSLFTHLTFGLLEGWWLHQDTALRIPGSPGITAEKWRQLLTEEGFHSIAFPAGEAGKFGQQIIAAGSDGFVRQQICQPPKAVIGENTIVAAQAPEMSAPKNAAPEMPAAVSDVSGAAGAALREESISYLQGLVAETLKIKTNRLDPARSLTEYGLDSILVNQLTTRLRRVFSDITSTLFFEVQTVTGLADYLITHNNEELMKVLPVPSPASPPVSPEIKPAVTGRKTVFQMKAPVPADQRSPLFDVAIIGVSGRYPQSGNLDEFWTNLSGGVNCISEIPEDRWSWQAYFDPERGKSGRMYTKWGGFLKDIDKFDPMFFKISPAEAEGIDPQERLFLEICYHAIEDAGYTPENLDDTRKIGVFAGVMNAMYSRTPSYFSISNRVSYLFDFQGPSMTVDTACSSSLTAIHLALESLYSGLSACCVAGGVNLIVDPLHYLRLTGMNMVSAGNSCKAFGANADGFIDAEGVGAVVLKPLAQAELDGDHIYGVIKASAVNAGGKTNGYTVPNPKAQSALVSEALKRAGISAGEVSYLEAHGTGTALGDPIEIAALTRAFKESTDQRQFCAIGSSKSNIGHSESAAGVAALTKVLLQLKHRQLVPSINANEKNPEIDFDKTPFKLQEHLGEWKRPVRTVNGVAREIPRIAGISSFGAGGANVHMIVQEYQPSPAAKASVAPGELPAKFIIPLSARTPEQVRQRAIDLLAHLRTAREELPADLPSLAFTLQTGRQAMEERLGFIVGSASELAEQLIAFIEEGEAAEGVYKGNIKNNRETLALFTGDPDLKEAIEKWMINRKFPKLIDLWVKGLDLDWNKLYGGKSVKRISLPLYPFARRRVWKDPQEPVAADFTRSDNNRHPAGYLHPLVHVNTSTLREQRFRATFTGNEFFLADHRVKHEKVLPGVAYLEMAREALSQALDGIVDKAVQLKNVAWVRPIIVGGEPCSVHIRLRPLESGEIAYEVYTGGGKPGDDSIIHSLGIASHTDLAKQPVVSLSRLQKQLNRRQLGAEECYEAFREAGIEYGPAHRGIEKVYIGENTHGATEVLARIKMPLSVSGTKDQFMLHPSILDSVLQASIGMNQDEGAAAPAPMLPFALEHLEITAALRDEMWAWIRDSASSPSSPDIQKLDIDLCDDQGRICVSLKGFSSRAPGGGSAPEKSMDAPEPAGTLLLRPVWRERPSSPKEKDPPSGYLEHQVFLCGLKHDCKALMATGGGIVFDDLDPGHKSLEMQVEWCAAKLFDRIKAILESKPAGNILLQVVIPEKGQGQLFSALSGLLKTAHLENTRLSGQVISLNEDITPRELVERLIENSRFPQDQEIRYTPESLLETISGPVKKAALLETADGSAADGGAPEKRMVKTFDEIPAIAAARELPWKEGGVYLITGGAGGLGLLFAREIAARIKRATLVLTGRSAPGKEKKASIRQLESAGVKVCYKAADVTDKDAVNRLIGEIVQDFGHLHGIIHSAGIVQDNFILKKTAGEFRSVLAPKVAGTIHLAEAARTLDLDLFVLFSSGAGAMGNAGQADYATANAFMDVFAQSYNEPQTAAGACRMVSINWPLWKEGGMRVDQATQKIFAQRMGLAAMETAAGIEAFYKALWSGSQQVLILSGSLRRIKQLYEQPAVSGKTKPTPNNKELRDNIQLHVTELISEALKIKTEDLDADLQLSEFGFDSISLTAFAGTLNERYQLNLNPTIFFEYPTIESFTGYLCESHSAVFAGLVAGQGTGKPETAGSPGGTLAVPGEQPRSGFRFAANGNLPAPAKTGADPVAIVGISGRFPEAGNLDEFWDNLIAGEQGIREVPRERWDWEEVSEGVKWGGFIDGIDEFDPQFFGISPAEAPFLDPLHRLLMTHIWSAIEDAGHAPRSLSGTKTGIFIGTGASGYSDLFKESDTAVNGFTPTGIISSMGPNRMSYFLNLHGPSEPVETACSSSLVAINRAITAMETGSCDQAIVGGVNIMLSPNGHIAFNKAGVLAADGVCRTFSGHANGYVRGEGIGILFLRKLKDAQADNDHIYALIRGGAENHGGRANSLTAPSPKAQSDVIVSAYNRAGVDPRTVSYIEAHGTGTLLGDSVEINGLKDAFEVISRETGSSPVQDARCGLGSVKTNIGHLEFASGIAGVIKILLQLRHKRLVASLNCDEISPYINLENSPFYVVREPETWEALRDGNGNPLPRRAGVSAFGFGGVNAHIVLEEYPAPADGDSIRPEVQVPEKPVAVILSARNSERLIDYAGSLLRFIQKGAQINLIDLAYTLQTGRDPMQSRLAMIVHSMGELAEKLRDFVAGNDNPAGVFTGETRRPGSALAKFSVDDDKHELTDQWFDGEQLDKLADAWVKGQPLDWNRLYPKTKPSRVTLPGYPFAREVYWVGRVSGTADMKMDPPAGSAAKGITPSAGANAATEKTAEYLKALIAEQLQVAAENIDSDESFFELGVDSLGITNLIGKMNHLLQENLIPSLVFEHRTIHLLAAFLVNTFPAKIEAALMSKQERPGGALANASAKEVGSVWMNTMRRIPETGKVLVPLQTAGERRPLFAIPGVGGNVLCFQPLSRALGSEQPFYGLQSVGLDGKTLPPDSVKKIAELNIEALKTVQPTGPYTLLGYSYGGVIAFEMAKQLLGQGEKIAFLLLLDSVCPTLQTEDELTQIVYLYKNLAYATGAAAADIDTEKLRRITGKERTEFLYNHTKNYGLDMTSAQFDRMYAVAIANARACSAYKPARLPDGINVSLFRATEGNAEKPGDYGWNKWLRRPLVSHKIEAGHFSIVDETPIREVARLILEKYNESDYSNSLRTT